jgi:short-subunit dehydrogenase
MADAKYAVVTGASQGIGKAILVQLLSEGFTVAVCGRNLQKFADVLRDYPTRVLATAADFERTDDVKAFGTFILENMPRVDVLVNNAGVFLPGNLADEPEGRLEMLVQVNLFAAYHLTRALLPAMKAVGGGHIFNMCSVAGLKAYPNGGAYSIAKYALVGFSANLRDELQPWAIKVTTICPGAVYTPSWAGSGVAPERIMEAQDVASMLSMALRLSLQANVDTLVMRPVKGDL